MRFFNYQDKAEFLGLKNHIYLRRPSTNVTCFDDMACLTKEGESLKFGASYVLFSSCTTALMVGFLVAS
jgi:hypothetical protein